MSRYNWNNMWIVFHCYWIQTDDWKAVSKAFAPLEIVYRVCSKFRKSWLESTLHQTIVNCTFRPCVLMFWWKECKRKLAQTQNGLECTFNLYLELPFSVGNFLPTWNFVSFNGCIWPQDPDSQVSMLNSYPPPLFLGCIWVYVHFARHKSRSSGYIWVFKPRRRWLERPLRHKGKL